MKNSAEFWAGGKKWHLSSPDVQMLQSSLKRFGIYESFIAALRHIIGDAHIIVDVGACIGLYSLLFHEACPGAEIIALEPSSHNYPFLLNNTLHIPQIRSCQLAASNKTETLTIAIPTMEQKDYLNLGGMNCGIISAYGKSETFRETTHAVRLDDLVETVDFVKIDAEGHDYPVLLGMQRLLANARPTVMVEFNKANFRMSGYNPQDIWKLFEKHEYQMSGYIMNDVIFAANERLEPGFIRHKLVEINGGYKAVPENDIHSRDRSPT